MGTATLLLLFLALLLVCFGICAFLFRQPEEASVVTERLVSLTVRAGESKAEEDVLLLRPARVATGAAKVNGLLSSAWISDRLQRLTLHAASTTSPQSILFSCVATGVIGFVAVFAILANVYAAAGAAVLLAYLPILRLQLQAHRRLKAFDAALPDAIDLCARSLRAGHSLVAAIGNVAEQGVEPVKSEFAEVFRLQNFGLPVRDALQRMMDRVESADLRVLVTGVMVQKDTGGNLAEVMDHITEVIRERVRIKAEIQVHTAQGRLTGWILCLLPVALLLMINVVSPGYSNVLCHDSFGQKLLYGSVVLLAIGAFLIRNIVRGIEV